MVLRSFGRRDFIYDINDGLPFSNAPEALAGAFEHFLTSGPSATDTSIQVNSVPKGIVADAGWVVIDPFTVQAEVRKIASRTGTTIGVSALTYSHAPNDGVMFLQDFRGINVQWFGAKGDGSTDDTAALQAAANAVSAYGGVMFIPNGQYLTDTLYFSFDEDNDFAARGRIHLTGEMDAFNNGAGTEDDTGTQLIHVDDSSNPLISIHGIATLARMVIIKNIFLKGGDSTTDIILLQRCSISTRLSNLWLAPVAAATNGIQMDTCWNANLQNINMRGTATGAGTYTGIGYYLHSESPAGVTMNNVTMINCTAGSMGRGMQIGYDDTTTSEHLGPISVIGCGFGSHDDVGMYVGKGVRGMTILDTHFELCYNEGLKLDNGAAGVKVLGCDFNDNGVGGGTYELTIGDTTEDCHNIKLDGIDFKNSPNALSIKSGLAQKYITMDNLNFVPETTGAGIGILIESSAVNSNAIFLGPNINFEADFATNISDSGNNLGRMMISNRYFTFSAGGSTPAVDSPYPLRNIRFNNSGATTVTNFTGGVIGQMLVIFFSNTNTTIQHNASNIKLNGATNYTPASANEILTLVRGVNYWIEQSRT